MSGFGSYTPGPFLIDRCLFSIIGANMNTTADQIFAQNVTASPFPFTNYVITSIMTANASTSLSIAAGGIYTAASKGGTPIVAAVQVYSGLTTSAKIINPTIANTDLRTTVPYLSLTTGQGGAATADFYIFGYALS